MPPSDFYTRILRNTCSLSVGIGITISFFIKMSGTVNILSQKHRRGQGRGLHPHSELANPETQQLWLQPPNGCCVRGAPARTPCPLIHVGPRACSLSPQKEGVCLHPPPEGIRSHRPPLCAVYWVNRGGGDGTSRSGPGAEGFVRKNPSHELAGACRACVPSPGLGASSERSASASGRGSPVPVVMEGGGPRGMSHSAPEGDGNRLRPERREPLPPSGQIGKWRGWFQAGP